jgi:hypothetical protein
MHVLCRESEGALEEWMDKAEHKGDELRAARIQVSEVCPRAKQLPHVS